MNTVLAPTSDLAKRLVARKKTLGRESAITAGIAVCEAAQRMSLPNRTNEPERHAARGACIYAMDNLWYDGLTTKARESFGSDRQAFYKACGWPD